MENQQQQHSYVKKVGTNFNTVPVTEHQTTGSRQIQISVGNRRIETTANQISERQVFIPLYNVLNVPVGTGAGQRLGNSIFIHRIEFQYCIRENPANFIAPEQQAANGANNVLFDPRYRIMIVNQKSLFRHAPISIGLTYPYFSATGDSQHEEPISPPVPTFNVDTDNGMIGLPDPKKYDLEYDDLRNLKMGSEYGIDSGSFSFLIRRRFDIDQDQLSANGQLRLTDSQLQELIPQIWMFFPRQASTYNTDGSYSSPTVPGNLLLSFAIRMIFDNVNS